MRRGKLAATRESLAAGVDIVARRVEGVREQIDSEIFAVSEALVWGPRPLEPQNDSGP